MAWFYYSGATTKPIPDGNGNIIAVRPHSKVELFKMGPLAKKLHGAGLLCRTGKPVDGSQIKPVEDVKPVKKVSEFAQRVAEKGVLGASSVKPVSVSKEPEMTAGEVSVGGIDGKDSGDTVVASDSVDGEKVEKKVRRRRKEKN